MPYIDVIQDGRDSQDLPLVATATHFFSYAWKYPWKVVLTSLQSFENNTGDVDQHNYYMIDQFCYDQHVMSDPTGTVECDSSFAKKLLLSFWLV